MRPASTVLFALGLATGSALAAAAAPAPAAAAAASAPSAQGKSAKPAKPAKAPPLVDINSASRAQLKTLPGIGDAEVERLIAGRPYLSKADLASKQVIPTGVYLSLKNRVIAKQGRMPPPKK